MSNVRFLPHGSGPAFLVVSLHFFHLVLCARLPRPSARVVSRRLVILLTGSHQPSYRIMEGQESGQPTAARYTCRMLIDWGVPYSHAGSPRTICRFRWASRPGVGHNTRREDRRARLIEGSALLNVLEGGLCSGRFPPPSDPLSRC